MGLYCAAPYLLCDHAATTSAYKTPMPACAHTKRFAPGALAHRVRRRSVRDPRPPTTAPRATEEGFLCCEKNATARTPLVATHPTSRAPTAAASGEGNSGKYPCAACASHAIPQATWRTACCGDPIFQSATKPPPAPVTSVCSVSLLCGQGRLVHRLRSDGHGGRCQQGCAHDARRCRCGGGCDGSDGY